MRKNVLEKPLDPLEEALLKRALGFSCEEVIIEETINRETGEVLETAKRRKVVKEVPPDVRALLFWLKNRRPERWSESAADAAADFSFSGDEAAL